MYNHKKAQQSKNRVHISWDILYFSLAQSFWNFVHSTAVITIMDSWMDVLDEWDFVGLGHILHCDRHRPSPFRLIKGKLDLLREGGDQLFMLMLTSWDGNAFRVRSYHISGLSGICMARYIDWQRFNRSGHIECTGARYMRRIRQ